MTQDQINNFFKYHSPTSDQAQKYEDIRSTGKKLAELIIDKCPSCEDRKKALSKLREAVMWANASIACNS